MIVAAVVGLLAVPGSSLAMITLGRSVGKVSIGMTQAEAEQAQGLATITRAQDPFTGEPQTVFDWGSFEGWIEGGNTITKLVVDTRGQRTFLGLGVGTKLKKLKATYTLAKCTGSRPIVCTIGRPEVSGTTVTEFEIRSGRVKKITIRLVP